MIRILAPVALLTAILACSAQDFDRSEITVILIFAVFMSVFYFIEKKVKR